MRFQTCTPRLLKIIGTIIMLVCTFHLAIGQQWNATCLSGGNAPVLAMAANGSGLCVAKDDAYDTCIGLSGLVDCECQIIDDGIPFLCGGLPLALTISGGDYYLGGAFYGGPGFDHIARWDGSAWQSLGLGLNGNVHAIASNGGDIFVGGAFSNAGGNPNADYIARWDGSSWNAVGNGLPSLVRSIAIIGNEIYAGGDFTDAGGNPNADYIARWDGSSWNSLGTGLNNSVHTIVLNSGNVYAGGDFTNAGGVPEADRIALWDGSTWNALGAGLNNNVACIAIDGSNVYAGGSFINAGGIPGGDRIAFWDGSSWNALGPGLNNTVASIVIIGNDVYAGGYFVNSGGPYITHIARWGELFDDIVISGVEDTVCQDGSPIFLPTVLSGYAGDWSGQGVSNNIFYPNGLNGEILITFTPNAGLCALPVDTFIAVINCLVCPAGLDTLFTICPYWSGNYGINHVSDLLSDLGLPLDGTWEPPLTCGDDWFTSCYDFTSVYIYPHLYPGCPVVYDTAHFNFFWDPCGWEAQDLCFADSTFYFTIPAYPGPGSTTYTLWVEIDATLYFFYNLNMDSSYTLSIPYDYNPGGALISAFMNGSPGCNWDLTLGICDYWFLIEDCQCSDPPYAGEDNSINICVDAAPFDLTTTLGGNPDPGGTWSPPLSSGNNIYDPVLDGAGNYAYSVTAPECPDDMASVTVNVVDLSGSTTMGTCIDPSTPSDSTDDVILISVTPFGNHVGSTYTVSVSSGGITPSSGLYNTTTLFELPPGSAGNGDVTLTITDNASPFCSFDFFIEDPGPCSNGLPCPVGNDTTIYSCPWWEDTYDLYELILQVPGTGYWVPPLADPIQWIYNSCLDSNSYYVETLSIPGCMDVQDTFHLNSTWDPPCNWEAEVCYTADSFYITIPSFPSYDGDNYNVEMLFFTEATNGEFIGMCSYGPLLPDSTYFLTCASEINNLDYDSLCHKIMVTDENTGCVWSLSGYTNEASWSNCNATLCSCSDPPYAGEDNSIIVCIDIIPFDLTTILIGNPDPGGSWTPALQSGGNEFNPVLDGSGTFTYSVNASGCPDDSASVTVIVDSLLIPLITGIPSTICEEALPIAFPTVQSGITGNWSGNGVSNNTFDPNGLMGDIVLMFSPDPNQCALDATTVIVVTAPVAPPISGIPSTYCESSPPLTLPTIQSGIIGNWSGTGVINNIFTPTGLSGMITLTFTPLPNQCALPAILTINVGPLISLTIVLPGPLCSLSPPIPLETNQSGINGNWSGQGVSNNMFNPTGLNGAITLTFTPNAGECALTTNAIIEVIAETTYNFTIPDSLCQFDAPIPLPFNPGNIIGNWSGPGVSNNAFDPNNLSGNISITFTPNSGQCAAASSPFIYVEIPVIPVLSLPDSVCETADDIPLADIQNGINGSWTGPGVINNVFSPNTLSGTISLSFNPDVGQCAVSATVSMVVTVPQEPEVNIPTVLCKSSDPMVLPTTLDGIAGEWFGPGVINNTFDPSSFLGIVVLTFTPLSDQCALETVVWIYVITEGIVSITEFPDTVCANSISINLVTIQDGIIGNWSGQGVINNTFNPAGLSGNQLLTFQPENSDCVDPVSANIYVQNEFMPDITGLPNSLCQLDTIVLPVEVDNVLGTWDGLGVTNFLFDPSGLSDSVLLHFNPDSGQCAAATSAYIMVTPAVQPVINGVPIAICQNNTSIPLSNLQDGISGSWYGSGITQDTFSPGGLSGINLIYFNPDPGQCALPVSSTIEILQPPGFSNLIAACDSTAQSYTVSFDIQGGLNGTYEVNGSIVLDSHYVSIPFDADSLFYSFVLDDANHCGPVMIAGSINCACATSAGTMELAGSPLRVCDGNDFTIVHHQDANLDPDDVLFFILHDQPGTLLGTVIATSTTTTFTFPTGINYGQVYYVSAVAGGGIGIDSLDLLDPCLSVSQGVPVIFLQTLQGSIQGILCPEDSIIFNNVVFNKNNPTGIEIFPGGSSNGCDSIVNIQLTFWPTATYSLTDTLCFGSSIMVNGVLFDESNPTGTEVFQGGSIHGCDSLIQISLSFDSIVRSDLLLTLCSGDSAVINGNVYDENHFEDDEVFENGSIYGCDSVLHVQLEFYEEILLEVKDTLAIGDSLIVNGQKYHAGYPVGIEIIQNGSSKGCDSTIVVDLYFQTNALTAKVLSIPPLCFGDSTGLVTIESISGGYDSIRLSLDGRPPLLVTDFPFSIQGLSAGTHSLWLVDAASLSDTLWIDIHLAAAQVLELDAGPDQEVNPGEDAQLNAQASFPVYSWLWSPVDFLSCTDCPDPVVIQPQHDILYTLLTEDLNGCQVSDDVLIQLSDDVKLYFPTIFSPNGDGINDFAMLSTNQELLVKSLSIFDRWGNLVSQQTDFSANDPSHGWDGTFNGKDMGPGVYVWLAEIEVESGVIKLYSGDVTLIR